jgi:hypothetical protein
MRLVCTGPSESWSFCQCTKKKRLATLYSAAGDFFLRDRQTDRQTDRQPDRFSMVTVLRKHSMYMCVDDVTIDQEMGGAMWA